MATEEDRIAHVLLVTLGDLGQEAATNTLKAEDHSGDCTKDAWTCLYCQAYEYREAARAVISKMRAMDREKAQSRDRHQQEVWGGKGGPM